MRFRYSKHAQQEMQRRGIPQEVVDSVLSHPEQVVPEREGLNAYQSKVDFGGEELFLLRAIIKDDVEPAVVITVYRTSKVDKYWRSS